MTLNSTPTTRSRAAAFLLMASWATCALWTPSHGVLASRGEEPGSGVPVAENLAGGSSAARGEDDGLHVRGMTLSCQTWGQEWGTDLFAEELDELVLLGVNWIAYHPYAWIRGDGSIEWREFDGSTPWLVRPIAEAHKRGLKVLVKPHLGYWGSPFSWRGAIDFPDSDDLGRFFADYERWIEAVAVATRDADAFAVGTELDRLIVHEREWRGVIAAVRGRTDAHLTYAANWTDFDRVPFWDALDTIGVQGYFPLVEEGHEANRSALVQGWREVLEPVRALSQSTGKPVVFTELGYDISLVAASEPWRSGRVAQGDRTDALALQGLCLETALDVLDRERSWLRGSFLWKWFPGPAPRANFLMDTAQNRSIIARSWGLEPPAPSGDEGD